MAAMREQLVEFVSKLGVRTDFDYVVPVERKGMALLRLLIGQGAAVPREAVISSRAVSRLPAESVSGKRFLVFDDTLLTGNGIDGVAKEIRAIGSGLPEVPKVATAAFFVHRYCAHSPNFALMRGLSDEQYETARRGILACVTASGQFLLDTDHIPLEFSFSARQGEVARWLSALGTPIVIPQPPGPPALALTFHRPRYFSTDHLALPEGASLQRVVCKLRCRLHPGRMWLVAMAYPSLPIHIDRRQCSLRSIAHSLCAALQDSAPASRCGDQHNLAAEDCFRCCGLVSSVELMRQSLVRLSGLFAKNDVRLERISMEHIPALYPGIDLERLRNQVTVIVKDALQQRQQASPAPTGLLRAGERSERYALAVEMALFHRRTMTESQGEAMREGPTSPSEGALSFRAIADSSTFFADEVEHSRAWDILIDRGRVIGTMVREYDNEGMTRLAHGLRLNGESVRRSTGKLYAVWGREYGFR